MGGQHEQVDPVGTLVVHDLLQGLEVAMNPKAPKAKGGVKGTMKWLTFMSTFVLNQMLKEHLLVLVI